MSSRRILFYIFFRGTITSAFFSFLLVTIATVVAPVAQSQTWKSLGPDGGDARALASDPSHPGFVYLGTTDGHIFGSRDGGRRWDLLGLAGSSHNAIVTSLIVDPRNSATLFASTWTREQHGEGGGIFCSNDGGRTWRARGLAGHAVRALVQAPSDPDTLVAGALDGVFRSRDAGNTWEMLTPAGDPELRNFDSLAIDPQNSEIIYAGTFHLPWKTTDGGEDWTAIHSGMIDDSDVLSLSVNPSNSHQVFASACSGIYRSEDSGDHWKRIQGIPDSSRRSLVIRFDPTSPGTLYAGTTEGLWKSVDAGARWRRISPSAWVINSLAVLPADDESTASRVLIGTEQQGVVVIKASGDGKDQFESANDGFEHRRIVSLTFDRENPERLAAVLVNASEPVISTEDGGKSWLPLGSGFEPGGVRRLFSTPAGWWAAVASGGLIHLDPISGKWMRAGALIEDTQSRPRVTTVSRITAKYSEALFRSVVNDLAFSDSGWLAATDDGLFTSNDAGATWSLLPFSSLALPVNSVRVSSNGEEIRIVSSRGMVFSSDAGRSWKWHDLPLDSYGAVRLEIADETTLLATSPTGLYISRDSGATWTKCQSGLPASPIDDLLIRPDFWIVSVEKVGLYLSRDRGANWSRVKNPAGAAETDYFTVVQSALTSSRIYAASASESLYLLDLSRPTINSSTTPSRH
ncbi:MAG TPA: YCF48-related protein [Terriglobales bacterium]|nr:YCF48-related protein [Terriglobales bacterium]